MPLETTLKAKVLDITKADISDPNFISQALTDGWKDISKKLLAYNPRELTKMSTTVSTLVDVGGAEYGIDFDSGVSEIKLTGVTCSAATPSIFTKTTHGLSTGDVVYLSGWTTNTALNGMSGVVNKITNDNFNIGSIGGTADTTASGTETVLRLGNTGYGSILHASRKVESLIYENCNEIPPTDRHRALDSTSLEYRSVYNPAYYIQDKQLKFVPKATATDDAIVSIIPYYIFDSESTDHVVPYEFERMLVLYAAWKVFLRLKADTIDSLEVDSWTGIDEPNAINLGFVQWSAALAEEDAELMQMIAQKLGIEVQEYTADIQNYSAEVQENALKIKDKLDVHSRKLQYYQVQADTIYKEYIGHFVSSSPLALQQSGKPSKQEEGSSNEG